MQITRRQRQGAVISLVAMVDVLMIMLVFFMVTSTFLDLDMIPMAERERDAPSPAGPGSAVAPGTPVMVRIGADGSSYLRGRALDAGALTAALRAPDLRGSEVLVLPSGQADVQALVRAMDAISRAEPSGMRILRVDASP
jgi:biopolymer transport protein ExbD